MAIYQLKTYFGSYEKGDFASIKKVQIEQVELYAPLMYSICKKYRDGENYNINNRTSLEYNHATDKYEPHYTSYKDYKGVCTEKEFEKFMKLISPNSTFDKITKFEVLETKVVNNF